MPIMENSYLDIRKHGWFEIFRDGLDNEDRKELDALAVRVNTHHASIAVAGHPFPNYVVMLSFMLENYKE
jgi:hypothetical protein